MFRIAVILLNSGLLFITHSCRPPVFDESPYDQLSFSTDTVLFDTVFTSIGSVTKRLKVYNNAPQGVRIGRIYLAGGGNTAYRLNIDGLPANDAHGVEIRSKDSLYVFVEVTINPFGANNPMMVIDSIVFETGRFKQRVMLLAVGQDVHFINAQWVKTTSWKANKPYLIYNSLAVDTGEVLTIEPGAKLYFRKNSYMYILGTLKAEGTLENPVLFRGERLDNIFAGLPYDKKPNQWGGIVFMPSSQGNQLNYCHVRNGVFGVFATLDPTGKRQAEISIKNSIFNNFSFAGLLLYNARISMMNCQVSNASVYLMAAPAGGHLEFYHCTFANYFNQVEQGRSGQPSVLLSNQFVTRSIYNDKDTLFTKDLEQALFANTIIYGALTNELSLFDNKQEAFNYLFDHCLIRVSKDSVDFNNPDRYKGVVFNEPPKFRHIPSNIDELAVRYDFNFALDTLSAAKDKGSFQYLDLFPDLNSDIRGISRRLDAAPDLGAYERLE